MNVQDTPASLAVVSWSLDSLVLEGQNRNQNPNRRRHPNRCPNHRRNRSAAFAVVLAAVSVLVSVLVSVSVSVSNRYPNLMTNHCPNRYPNLMMNRSRNYCRNLTTNHCRNYSPNCYRRCRWCYRHHFRCSCFHYFHRSYPHYSRRCRYWCSCSCWYSPCYHSQYSWCRGQDPAGRQPSHRWTPIPQHPPMARRDRVSDSTPGQVRREAHVLARQRYHNANMYALNHTSSGAHFDAAHVHQDYTHAGDDSYCHTQPSTLCCAGVLKPH